MNSQSLKETIIANAYKIMQLHQRIHEALRNRNKTPQHAACWQTACAEFHSQYDDLAFPGGYSSAFELIAANDPEAIETALCFVE